jgi:hypothetical protein
MGMIITSTATRIEIDFQGTNNDIKWEIIKLSSIRDIEQSTDDETINITYTNGEIQYFNFNDVDDIDGDTSITSQLIFWNKLESIIFP